MTTKVSELIEQVRSLTPRQRHELVQRLAGLPELQEDLYDLGVYAARKDEPRRSYRAFREELVSEGLL